MKIYDFLFYLLLAMCSFCEQQNCGQSGTIPANIEEGLGFKIRDWNISWLTNSVDEPQRSLLFCFETVLGQQPNNASLLTGIKVGRRFSLSDLGDQGSECPAAVTVSLLNGKKLFKVELRWNNKVHLNATFMQSQLDITDTVLKNFNGSISLLIDFLFSAIKDDKILPGSAFLADYPLDAIRMAMLLSRQQNLKQPSIIYKLCEPSNLTNETRNALIKACDEEIAEWNREAGMEMYECDEDCCLHQNEERHLLGVVEIVDQFPEGQNQSGGGRSYTGPVVPIPLKPVDELEYNTEFTVNINYTKPKGRSKRNVLESEFHVGQCKYREFDLRKNSVCGPVIATIRNQGRCDYCWAVSSAGTLTDRVCIAAQKHRALSKLDIMENDTALSELANHLWDFGHYASARDAAGCSDQKPHTCDEGGSTFAVWRYYSREGTVNEKCKPYPDKEPLSVEARRDWEGKCHHQCDQKTKGYGSLDFLRWGFLEKSSFDSNSYHKEMNGNEWKIVKMFAGSLYSVSECKSIYGTVFEQTVMDEIRNNGTVTASFNVYFDFWKFKHKDKHIYSRHPDAKRDGRHAVRLIGYGSMQCPGAESVKYWLAASTWGSAWGDNGIFRIVRGNDESGIESNIIWGSVFFPF